MTTSKAMTGMHALLPHLVHPGGIPGEVLDLRNDVNTALLRAETPGHGGTSLVAIEEWNNCPTLVANFFMLSTNFTAAAQVLTGTALVVGAVSNPPRNIICGVTIGAGVGAGTMVVHGTDVNDNVIFENFTVPAATNPVTGVKAFKTVTRVDLPAILVGAFAGSVVIGQGVSIGLGSKVKLRNAAAAVLFEIEDSVFIGGAGVNATAVNQLTTTTVTAIKFSGQAHFEAPDAAALTGIVNTVDCAPGVQAIAAQPDYPRKLQLRMVEGGAAITVGTCTLVGVGADGDAVTQVINLPGGTKTVVTDGVYATLTSATVSALTGGGAGTTIGIGVGAAMGLPIPAVATAVTVNKTIVSTVAETVAGVDVVARAVAPTTPADAARIFDFFYSYLITPVSPAHLHVQNAHSHGGVAAGVVSSPLTGLPHGLYTPTNAPNGARTYVLAYERDLVPVEGPGSIVQSIAIANGPQTIFAQPDAPCKLQMQITDPNTSISAGTVTFLGTSATGAVVTEVISIASQGTKTYRTTNVYALITSITVAALAGAAGTDLISVGAIP